MSLPALEPATFIDDDYDVPQFQLLSDEERVARLSTDVIQFEALNDALANGLIPSKITNFNGNLRSLHIYPITELLRLGKTKGELPVTLRVLSFSNTLVRFPDFNEAFLPDALSSLDFGDNFTGYDRLDDDDILTNWQTTNNEAIYVPDSVKILTLGAKFNRSIRLPALLDTLYIGAGFDSKALVFPSSLKTLTIDAPAFSITANELPDGLLNLSFTNDAFHDPLPAESLPRTLLQLHVPAGYPAQLQHWRYKRGVLDFKRRPPKNDDWHGVMQPYVRSIVEERTFSHDTPSIVSHLKQRFEGADPLELIVPSHRLNVLVNLGAKVKRVSNFTGDLGRLNGQPIVQLLNVGRTVGTLPRTLQQLSYDEKFTDFPVLDRGYLPESLVSLNLGNFNGYLVVEDDSEHYPMNQNEEKSSVGDVRESVAHQLRNQRVAAFPFYLPWRLQSLTVGPRFTWKFVALELPRTLQELTFEGPYPHVLGSGVIPATLTTLRLGNGFNLNNIKYYPQDLRKLVIGGAHDIPGSWSYLRELEFTNPEFDREVPSDFLTNPRLIIKLVSRIPKRISPRVRSGAYLVHPEATVLSPDEEDQITETEVDESDDEDLRALGLTDLLSPRRPKRTHRQMSNFLTPRSNAVTQPSFSPIEASQPIRRPHRPREIIDLID